MKYIGSVVLILSAAMNIYLGHENTKLRREVGDSITRMDCTDYRLRDLDTDSCVTSVLLRDGLPTNKQNDEIVKCVQQRIKNEGRQPE